MNPGLRLSCFDSGENDRPVILFLHGFLGSFRDWLPIMEHLSDKYRCLAPDLPGHGASAGFPQEVSYDIKNTARAVLDLIHQNGIRPCTVVGYSMGGRVAMALAKLESNALKQLILVSASPGITGEDEREQRKIRDDKLSRSIESDFEGFLKSWYSLPLFTGDKPTSPEDARIPRHRRGNRPAELARSLREAGQGTHEPFFEMLKACAVPWNLLVGENDKKYLALGKRLAREYPGKVIFVPDAAHTLFRDNPPYFLTVLRNLITD